jgi:hypothetical protein
MARVFFVTGSKGGVESLQRRGAVRKSNGVGIVLNISLMGSATTPHRVAIYTMFFRE